MKIFAGGSLREYLDDILNSIRNEIYHEDKNGLLNANEAEYVDYLVNKHSIDAIEFGWDELSVSDQEEMIPAEQFPPHFNVYKGKRYPKQVITYHLPYTGTYPLLSLKSSRRLSWAAEVHATPPSVSRPGEISFDIINWRDDPEEIKREADEILSCIRQQTAHVISEVESFNTNLEQKVTEILQTRKEQLLRESNMLASLGVPIRKAQNVPETFAVPIPVKKIRIQKPKTKTDPFAPEPTLDPSTYKEILRICHQAGMEMERHPGIYLDKDEETLRDHFIMVLAPHFESVTGETFNRVGKTDILIRHEGANVFVAECKFWKGKEIHRQTLDQILKYLTWRDSKTAVLYFVKNKNLGPALQKIMDETPNHTCFVKYRVTPVAGWFDFTFHLPEDDTRGVELAVLCFHFPDQ